MSESIDPEVAGSKTSVNTGRYLYCLVAFEERELEESTRLDVSGIDDEPVFLIPAADASIGAVVHARPEPYDSSNLTKLRDWLLAHQRVVEAVGDRFGTPLPVRFDTVLQGDDETARDWLANHVDAIDDAFDTIAGRWEYRVTLSWDSTPFETEQRRTDAKLTAIDEQLDEAGQGTNFLLQKRADQRLRDLTNQRRDELKQELIERLGTHCAQLTERPIQSDMAESLGVDLRSDAIAQVAVLAAAEAESALGHTLDEFTDIQGVDIRFTGPWPPYTFAPTITDD